MQTYVTDPAVTSVMTRDIDEAHDYIDRVFTPHRLVLSDTSTLGFGLHYVHSSRVTLGHLTYGADVMVDVPAPEDCYHVTVPIRGTCRVRQNREDATVQVGRSAAILSPDDRLGVWWHQDSVQYILKIPRSVLEGHLGRTIGRPVQEPVRFSLGFDLGEPGGQALSASVSFLWRELSRPGGIADMVMAREHLECVVLSQLLTVVPHNYSDALADPALPVRRRRIQQLVDYIDAHPESSLTGTDLAARLSVTERTVQMAFQKALGTSPAAYVRAVRLEARPPRPHVGGGRSDGHRGGREMGLPSPKPFRPAVPRALRRTPLRDGRPIARVGIVMTTPRRAMVASNFPLPRGVEVIDTLGRHRQSMKYREPAPFPSPDG